MSQYKSDSLVFVFEAIGVHVVACFIALVAQVAPPAIATAFSTSATTQVTATTSK